MPGSSSRTAARTDWSAATRTVRPERRSSTSKAVPPVVAAAEKRSRRGSRPSGIAAVTASISPSGPQQ